MEWPELFRRYGGEEKTAVAAVPVTLDASPDILEKFLASGQSPGNL